MCMNNMNASIFLTTGLKVLERNVHSLGAIFNGVIPKEDDNGYYLPEFSIMLNISVMFDLDEDSKTIIEEGFDFKLNKKYELMIRLSHVDSGLGVSLDKFDLEISSDKLKTWSKGFYEFRRFIKVPHLTIPKGLGNYTIKLLIREKDDNNEGIWKTQAISSLVVGDKG